MDIRRRLRTAWEALQDLVTRDSGDRVTEKLNDVVDAAAEVRDDFAPAGARRMLTRVDW